MAMQGYEQSQLEVSDKGQELLSTNDKADVAIINKWLKEKNTSEDKENDKFIEDKGNTTVKSSWERLKTNVNKIIDKTGDKFKDILYFDVDKIAYHIRAKEANKDLDDKVYGKLDRIYSSILRNSKIINNPNPSNYNGTFTVADYDAFVLQTTYSTTLINNETVDPTVKADMDKDIQTIKDKMIESISNQIKTSLQGTQDLFEKSFTTVITEPELKQGTLAEVQNSQVLLTNTIGLYTTKLNNLNKQLTTFEQQKGRDKEKYSKVVGLSLKAYDDLSTVMNNNIKTIKEKISTLETKKANMQVIEKNMNADILAKNIVTENSEDAELTNRSKETRKYYANKEDLIYLRANVKNPNGHNAISDQEVKNKEGQIKDPTIFDITVMNASCINLGINDKLIFEGGASATPFTDSKGTTKAICDQQIESISGKLNAANKVIFETKIADYNKIKSGDGNSYLARGRALKWCNGLNEKNINANINKVSFEIKLGGDPKLQTSRSGSLKFSDGEGNVEYKDLEQQFPDALFLNNISTVNMDTDVQAKYKKNQQFIGTILSEDPNSVVLLEGFTGTTGQNYGGVELNTWFSDNIFAQEELLTWVKPGSREEFKKVQNTLYYDTNNIKKYFDMGRMQKELTSKNIPITKVDGVADADVLAESFRRIALSINRSEKIRDDVVATTLSKMNVKGFTGTKQTKQEVQDRVYMVGHGTGNRDVGIKKDYRRGSFTILQKS